jgi:signal peptidase II
LLLWISLLVIIADQVSKWLVLKYLAGGPALPVWPGVFDFAYVENRGAAFGMLQNQKWLFLAVTALLVIVIVVNRKFIRQAGPLVTIGLALMLGGAIGNNFIDRVFRGYVVDFIHVLFVEFAVFNIADSAVVIGAILLGLAIIKGMPAGH